MQQNIWKRKKEGEGETETDRVKKKRGLSEQTAEGELCPIVDLC